MKIVKGWRWLLVLSLVAVPASLPAVDEPRSAAQEEKSFNPENIGRTLRGLFDRWRENFGIATAREERPLISLMLRHRDRLGLSAEQVRNLERVRNDFAKESIRTDAELRIAEMDLESLLHGEPVEMPRVEDKIREIERHRADLRIARIKAIENGKEQLSGEQRKKFQELVADQYVTRVELRPRARQDLSALR